MIPEGVVRHPKMDTILESSSGRDPSRLSKKSFGAAKISVYGAAVTALL